MRKYVFMAMLVSLCACNNGGGHGGGGAKYNIGSSAGISGGTTTKPGEQPGGDNTTEKPGDNTQQPSDNIKYPNVPDSKKLTVSMGTFSTSTNEPYRIAGVFDKENEELRIQRLRPYQYTYTSTCQEESGCDLSYNYGEYYYKFTNYASGKQEWYRSQCDLPGGCASHADQGKEITVICRDINGCLLENDSEPEIIFDLKNSTDGKFVKEFSYNGNAGRAEFTVGSKNSNVPLRFSDFGYWERIIPKTAYGHPYSVYTFAGWKSGDPARAVDMHTLADIGVITGNHTYSGKAFVGISTGKTNKVGSSSGYEFIEIDDMPGFTADGTVKLSFNADNGTENLVMDFTDAGWYKVYTKDNELVYVGNPTTDPKFKVENPKSIYTKDIQYYGPDAFLPATETVGTVGTSNVQMQDGYYRDINFSFGAVKD